MNLSFTNKLSDGVYEIPIRGIIGSDISGKAIGAEIDYLNEIGATSIIERINSAGGDVFDGYNIVSANLRSKTPITTINEGIAASMAAVILATGDNRQTMDYATALIHDPQMNGVTLEKIEDEQQRSNIQKVKDSLVKILTDSCNRPKNTISKLMTRESVLNAQEMKDFGMVDTILKSRALKPNLKNLDLTQIMNVCNDLNTKTIKSLNMDKLTNFFGLNSDASEESILTAAKAMQSNVKELTNQLNTLKGELSKKDTDLTKATEQLKSIHAQTVSLAVENAIKDGKFTEDKREMLTNQANKDLEMFNTMVSSMPVQRVTVTDVINQNGGGKTDSNSKDEKHNWDYYQKNDPKYLQNLERTDKQAFDKLYNEYVNSLT